MSTTSTPSDAAAAGEGLFDLFLLAPVGIVTFGANGRVQYLNPAARQLLGTVESGDLRESMVDLLGDRIPDLATRLRQSTTRGEVVVRAPRVLLGAGTRRALVGVTVVRVDDDRFAALLVDATELAVADARAAHERTLRATMDGVVRAQGFFTLDADGRIDEWGISAERLTGFTTDDVRGQPLDVLAPEDTLSPTHVAETLALAQRNGWCEEEGWRRRRNAGSFWGAMVVTAIRDDDSTLRGYSVALHDVTERRAMLEGARDDGGTDYLTGVANRRGFFEVAASEIGRARRYSHALTLVLVDPDQFRGINDQYGTAFGDECLQAVSWVCRQESRQVDVVGRVGGEEFAVLLPSTDLSGGLVLAERIRERMQRHVFGGDHAGVRCTLSLGVAELTPETAAIDDLLRLAELAVQRAKQAGRNLVVGYDA
ncbi:MAG: diguanylate cyclase [Gemmatimonadaceae bacterium]|nr:diguanylate cyclase [Gemmatimonadaceae bacterium]